MTGDLRQAITSMEQALDQYTKVGNVSGSREGSRGCLLYIAWTYHFLGDIQKEREYAERAFQIRGSDPSLWWERSIWGKPRYYERMGECLLSEGALREAEDTLRQSVELYRAFIKKFQVGRVLIPLARAQLAQRKSQEATESFRQALELMGVRDMTIDHFQGLQFFANIMAGLEEAYGDAVPFQRFCCEFRKEHPEVNRSSFTEWYLQPTEAVDFTTTLFRDEFNEPLLPEWSWHDPFGDCAHEVRNGLEIRAANGRRLWYINWSAPRILRPVTEDFAVETTCRPALNDRPAIGGILLWKDKDNYLHIDSGMFGHRDVAFMGCIDAHDVLIGRGNLPPGERVYLRMERSENQVKALCSADGVEWFAVGRAKFSIEDPVEVGLLAVDGHFLMRTIYHGAFPEGTAIRFESFELQGR